MCIVEKFVLDSPQFPMNFGYTIFFLLNNPMEPDASAPRLTVAGLRAGKFRLERLFPVIVRHGLGGQPEWEKRDDYLCKQIVFKYAGN